MSQLNIEGLSIKFGGIKALSDVSLEVKSGEFVGLMGPNGAGKTSVINCISRIYDPLEGKISFDGQDLLQLSGQDVLQLGIARTFQDLNFFSHISNMMVIDYMRLGQFNDKDNSFLRSALKTNRSRKFEWELKKRARRVLEFFREIRESLDLPEEERGYPYIYGREGFPDLLDVEFRPIGVLSFAWRRRLDLARALVSNPKLLLLDEPAQGLPPSEIEKLGKTLKFIQAEFGVSALIVEHNVATLLDISDRIIMMNLGQTILQGKPEEVKDNPKVIEIYFGTTFQDKSDSPAVQPKVKKNLEKELPILEVKNVDVYYGSAQALFNVSLTIKPGSITSVLGTNGSGKSTLLKTISGAEKPASGEILFRGEHLPLGWPEVAVERGIQYVPQGHVIFPELTVLDNIRIGAHIFEKTGLKFEEGLEKVLTYFPGLKEYLGVQAASLSGGLQQMLSIGQAIVGKPELLLLDEPSLGLSPKLVEDLFEIIRLIGEKEGCAVMLIEQNVKKALDISDYVYMLSSGVLIGHGTSDQLRENDATLRKYLGFR